MNGGYNLTNSNLLKAKMIAVGDEHFTNVLSDVLNISRTTASRKLNGLLDFTQSEINKLKSRYNLSAEDIDQIFYEGE